MTARLGVCDPYASYTGRTLRVYRPQRNMSRTIVRGEVGS